MAIKITCPNCKRGMLVPENLAGKKGRCKACQHILTVPKLAATNSPAAEAAKPEASVPAKPPAPPRASADVEAEAAALFADEPKPAESVEVKLIDLNCPFCDEAIQFPIDLAGKRAPCPECKHIIKVPEPVKKDPKDWRKVEARGPTGARLPDQPELEGAWSSTTVRGVGAKTLEEAGVLPKTQPPRTLWQKLRWPVVGASLVLLVSVGGWMGYRWWSQRAADRALAEALTFASTPEAKPLAQAALSIGAGEYYVHSRTSHKNPPGKEASDQFGNALKTLSSASEGDERDALLTDLALALIELGGDKPDTDTEYFKRIPWEEIQKRLSATLGRISDAEARLQALRAVAQRLVAHGQSARVQGLTNQVYPRDNAAKTADQAAALAVVALEFLKVKDQQSADKAANAALDLYKNKPKPPLRAEVVAVAKILKKEAPEPGDDEDDKANEHLGNVAALARQRKWDEARHQAGVEEYGEVVQFRARLAIAAAAVDDKVPDTTDIEAAIQMAEGNLSTKAELSWSLLRLTQLALATTLPEDRVQALADKIGNSAVRSRAQLAIFRARLAQMKQPAEDSAADKVDTNSLARSLAAEALARHNTRLGANYAAVVQGWAQPQRAFGSLGVALGLQDRER
jgi:hypothetical protein